MRSCAIGHDGRRDHRNHRGHRGEQQAVDGGARECRPRRPVGERLRGPHDQLHHRKHEHDRQQRRRETAAAHRAGPCGRRADHGVAATERLVVAGAPTQQPLERDERQRQADQYGRQLQGRGLVEGAVPDTVDRVRQRAIAEQVDGTEVRQRLHHGQRDAGAERRTSQRQCHAQHRPPVGQAERSGRLERLARLAQERAAPQHVDVRVEDQRQHRDRARRGADVGQADAEERPNGALERRSPRRTGRAGRTRGHTRAPRAGGRAPSPASGGRGSRRRTPAAPARHRAPACRPRRPRPTRCSRAALPAGGWWRSRRTRRLRR